MAYVRKTDDIYRYIRASIETMFRNRIEHAKNWSNYGMGVDEINMLCWNELIPSDKEAFINELGKLFFNTPDMSTNVTVGIVVDANNDVRYELPVGRSRLLPGHWLGSYRSADLLKITDPRVVAVAAARKLQVDAVANEQSEFLAKVKKIWDDVPSVNTFVKVWPPGLELLRSDVREELAKPSSRSKMSDLSTTMDDINELNANLLRAKVAV